MISASRHNHHSTSLAPPHPDDGSAADDGHGVLTTALATSPTTPLARPATRLFFRTASIDSLNFLLPTHVGDIVTVRAYVSRVFKSSMEVYVTVHASSLRYRAFAHSPPLPGSSSTSSRSSKSGGAGDDQTTTTTGDDHDDDATTTAKSEEWKLTNDGYLTVVAFEEDGDMDWWMTTETEDEQPPQQLQQQQQSPQLMQHGTPRKGSLKRRESKKEMALMMSTTTTTTMTATTATTRGLGVLTLPPVVPQTAMERWRYENAEERRTHRLQERSELKRMDAERD